MLPHFVAYSATKREFGMAWRNMSMEPPRKELTELITKGISKRELDPKLDLELSLALLLGPALYWHIFRKRPFTEAKPLAEFSVDAFWSRFGLNFLVRAGLQITFDWKFSLSYATSCDPH